MISGEVDVLRGVFADNCPGNITKILDWPSKCDGHVAVKLDSNPSNWICALSDKSDFMILTAYAAKKWVDVRLDSALSQSCETLTNYHVPHYISITD